MGRSGSRQQQNGEDEEAAESSAESGGCCDDCSCYLTWCRGSANGSASFAANSEFEMNSALQKMAHLQTDPSGSGTLEVKNVVLLNVDKTEEEEDGNLEGNSRRLQGPEDEIVVVEEETGVVLDKITKEEQGKLFDECRVAALLGRAKKLERLLSQQQKNNNNNCWLLDAGDEFGRTLLQYACVCDRLNVVKLLFKKGASLQARDNRGRTAFHISVERNSVECARWFLTSRRVRSVLFPSSQPSSSLRRRATVAPASADLGYGTGHSWNYYGLLFGPDSKGITTLHLACRLRDITCLKELLSAVVRLRKWDRYFDFSSLDFLDEQSRSPLHWAAAFGLANHLAMLLEQKTLKFDIVQADCDGKTPLMYVMLGPVGKEKVRSAVECAKLLVGSGPSRVLESVDADGLSCLHLAAARGNAAILDLLLRQYKCSADIYDNQFRTPLHHAATKGHLDTIRVLVNCGAKNSRDRRGATPLHYCSLNGHWQAVELLLRLFHFQPPQKAGEDPAVTVGVHRIIEDASDSKGRSAFMWAVVGGQLAAAKSFLKLTNVPRLEKDQQGLSALHLAVEVGEEEMVRLLLDHHWPTEAVDSAGLNPLLVAVARGRSRVARLLLSQRGALATLSARDQAGRGALHWACLGGHTFLVKMLVGEFGVDTEMRDVGGRTPLHCAAFAGSLGCVSTLLQLGADPFVNDHENLTALHVAAKEGHTPVASVLLEHGCPVNGLAFYGLEHDDDHDQDLPQHIHREGTSEDQATIGRVAPYCRTPTDFSLENGHQSLVELFLSHDGMTYYEVSELAATLIQANYRQYRVRKHYRNSGSPLRRPVGEHTIFEMTRF